MLMPTRILVPTDFSEYSDRALGQALQIARQYKAKVFLLHVVHEDIYGAALEFTLSEETVQRFKDDTVSRVRESLQKQLGYFPQAKEVDVATNIRWGVPYNEILKEGKEQGIDLIVIASLGRSGIAKYLIGSVARNVLKGSRCPVLLVK
ncbi:MAG: universal stress protein [Syntrophorhabdaceae bacterium]|nr:universal stress protein [Syntrophorhabdaceae bacterium]MDD4195270.1 universal stress protein [Syntrophorhabdaceae bacterium]HOC45781.1 universal stress protein [Syntrophorhabdaceae bacterium]